MRRPALTVLTLAAAASAFVGLGSIAAPVASASSSITASSITATYPVSGTTHLKAPNATVPLGPGTLSSTVDLTTGAITASTLTLPPATGSFKVLGLIPVSATSTFNQVGTASGTVNFKTNSVIVTTQANMQLTSLKVAGLPIPVGPGCQTSTPITIAVNSQPGFNLLNGGVVAGTYTIPRFVHCGFATFLINLTVPGSGNTISLTLGKATL